MQRIGFFGGSFNPIHNGHIALAERLRAHADLSEVWFVVSPQNPFKRQQDLLDDATRLKMVELSLNGRPGLRASDCEFRLPRPSFTYITLRHLREANPQTLFVLLIGSDNWAAFPHWKHHEEIVSHHPIVIYPRPGHSIDASTLPQNVSLAPTPQMDISSTEIRRRVRSGEPIAPLVPLPITDLIIENYK